MLQMSLLRAYPGPHRKQLSPSSLGSCLGASLDRLARLQYLRAVMEAEQLPSATSVLFESNQRFNARHPGYPAWLRDNAERLQGENPSLKLRSIGARALM